MAPRPRPSERTTAIYTTAGETSNEGGVFKGKRSRISPNENLDPITFNRRKKRRSRSASETSTVNSPINQKQLDQVSTKKRRKSADERNQPTKRSRIEDTSEKFNVGVYPTMRMILDHYKALITKELPGFIGAELREYHDYVKMCYEKVQDLKGPNTADIALFHSNREKYKMKSYKIPGISVPKKCITSLKGAQCSLSEISTHKNRVKAFYREKEKLFTSTQQQPGSKCFILTEKNILTPDCLRLSHVPPIEKHRIDEMTWHSLLRKTFQEGVHGDDEPGWKRISQYEIYLMLKVFHESKIKDYSDSKTRYKILMALFTLFPASQSYSILKKDDLFEKYKARFEVRYQSRKETNKPLMVAKITEILCAKCGNLHCLQHKMKPADKKVIIERFHVQDDLSKGKKKCSKRCGLNNGTVLSKYSPAYPKFENSLLEQVFISRLAEDFDTCKLAKEMASLCKRPLTCEQLKLIVNAEKANPPPRIPHLLKDRHKIFKKHLDNIDNNGYHICDHDGPCEKENTNCPCFVAKTACSLECKCGKECKILFPGCNCNPGECRTKACACVLAGWECNPLTCTTCNSDTCQPKQDYPYCQNIAIQNGWKKSLGIGISTLPNAGLGLFALQDIKKFEHISEYCGEVISEAECDRRGCVYDELFLSYIFKLSTDESAIDAFKMGNLMRYANNISKEKKPNCSPRIIKVNGDIRIAIFANVDIKTGEELFFDYGYTKEHNDQFNNQKSRRRAKELCW